MTGFKGRSRPLVPRQARARAERRGGQVARRVRRAVGQGGRQAARGPRPPRRPTRPRRQRGPMRARRPRRTLLAGGWLALASALALLLGPALATADKAGSVTASGGAVQATLSWQAADFGVKDPRLSIVRARSAAVRRLAARRRRGLLGRLHLRPEQGLHAAARRRPREATPSPRSSSTPTRAARTAASSRTSCTSRGRRTLAPSTTGAATATP